MNYKTLFLIGASALGLAACTQQITPEVSSPKVLGVLEVKFDSDVGTQAVFRPNRLSTQNVLLDSQIDVTSAGAAVRVSESNGPRVFDYVSKNFTVTNNTGSTVNNLTLVALEQTGNLSGAIKSATDFGGNATDNTTADKARPTHAMTASAGIVSVDNATPARAGFQALTAAEASAIQGDANFAGQGFSGTVLEYGFVATNTAGTNRTILDTESGNLTIAYRFPTSGTGTYNFVLTFVVTAETANRVTRSPEETTTNANTRATALGATEKVLIDDPTVITTPPTGYTVQNNVKVSTTKNLLVNPGKLVIARANTQSVNSSLYNRDFVEIFNSGEFSVSLSGKSIQYGATAGAVGAAANQSLTLSSIAGPGEYKLVRFGNGEGTLPSPTLVGGNNSIDPAAAGGKLALVNSSSPLGCTGTGNDPATACTNIIDFLGYGTANLREGTAAPAASSSTEAITRANRGCKDTNSNLNDFAIDALSVTNPPRNSNATGSFTPTPPFICP
jgi:hypothetical protein